MALKIILKPYEKIIIAGAVVTNGGSGTSLLIENNVPVLRKKDILKEDGYKLSVKDSTSSRRMFIPLKLDNDINIVLENKDKISKTFIIEQLKKSDEKIHRRGRRELLDACQVAGQLCTDQVDTPAFETSLDGKNRELNGLVSG